jgi:plasmid stabilization system protein ParE
MPTEEKEANVEEVAPDEALMEAYSATGFPILGEKAFWTGWGRKAGGYSVSKNRDSRDKEQKTVPIDPEGEQRELEAAGWERMDVQGKVLWVNPQSGHRYPQGPAIRRLRQIQEEAEQGRGEGRGVSEKELGRLRQAVARLLDAQEDASDAARRGLEHEREDVDYEESSAVSTRLEEALVDILNILEGALSDVRAILEDNVEERRE